MGSRGLEGGGFVVSVRNEVGRRHCVLVRFPGRMRRNALGEGIRSGIVVVVVVVGPQLY